MIGDGFTMQNSNIKLPEKPKNLDAVDVIFEHFYGCLFSLGEPEHGVRPLRLDVLQLYDPASKYNGKYKQSEYDFTIRALKRPYTFYIYEADLGLPNQKEVTAEMANKPFGICDAKQDRMSSLPQLTTLIKGLLYSIIQQKIPPITLGTSTLGIKLDNNSYRPDKLPNYNKLLANANKCLFASVSYPYIFNVRDYTADLSPGFNIFDELV